MAQRELPLTGRNFEVSLSVEDSRGRPGVPFDLACSEVVFPSFRLDGRDRVDDRTPPPSDPRPTANLVLRRGFTGSTELHDLWRAARDKEKEQLRTVEVVLLDESFERVAIWQFRGCHVVSLDYTMLDALAEDVLEESLEISFKRMDQLNV